MAIRAGRDACHNVSRLAGVAGLLALARVPVGAQQVPSDATQPQATELPPVTVIGTPPLLGSGVDRNKVPSEGQVLTNQDVTLQGPPSYLDTLQSQAQGV